MADIFTFKPPLATPLPILANLPHSGLKVPDLMQQQLNEVHQSFLPHQDWHLDQLYDFLPTLGVTLLQATHSRYVVDLNRSLKKPYFGNFWRSAIPEKTAYDAPLYAQKPSSEEIERRIDTYFLPYHEQLAHQLNDLITQFGRVYLLDLHSFYGPITDDICLGNGHGKTCSPQTLRVVEQAFADQGYGVVRNKVFNGGHITQYYGRQPRVEALQIEVRYPVYLEATQLDKKQVPDWQGPEFADAKQRFKVIFQQITENLR